MEVGNYEILDLTENTAVDTDFIKIYDIDNAPQEEPIAEAAQPEPKWDSYTPKMLKTKKSTVLKSSKQES